MARVTVSASSLDTLRIRSRPELPGSRSESTLIAIPVTRPLAALLVMPLQLSAGLTISGNMLIDALLAYEYLPSHPPGALVFRQTRFYGQSASGVAVEARTCADLASGEAAAVRMLNLAALVLAPAR